MKQTVLKLMRVTGAFAPFRRANRDKALILTYHRFSQSGTAGTTSANAFAKQLQYLTTHYRLVNLSTLVEYLSAGSSLPAGIACIAIDDGYRDAYEVAFPILNKYSAPATLFVVSEFVDQKTWLWTDKMRFLATRAKPEKLNIEINNRIPQLKMDRRSSLLEAADWVNSSLKQMPDEMKDAVIIRLAASLGVELPDVPPDEYSAITWNQAREMETAGVEIGSHTLTHPILTRVKDDRLQSELFDSRSRIETMLGHKVEVFCYPNGDYDEQISRAVRAAGYKCAVTVETGLNALDSDMFKLRRVHTDNNFTRFIQCTSGFEEIKNRFMYARRGTAAVSAH